MSSLINIESIENAEYHSEPFEWCFIPEVFNHWSDALALAEAFPEEGYTHYTRHNTAKNYDTYGRFLVKMGHRQIYEPESQPPIWRRFAEELLTDDYVRAVEKATGVQLCDTHMEAVYWRLPAGCTIDPHLDNTLKRVSHLFYFNSEWAPENGGYLRLLRSWSLDDCLYEFPPLLNTSLMIVRSKKSWHGYKPVEGNRIRKAIQVSFCTCAAV